MLLLGDDVALGIVVSHEIAGVVLLDFQDEFGELYQGAFHRCGGIAHDVVVALFNSLIDGGKLHGSLLADEALGHGQRISQIVQCQTGLGIGTQTQAHAELDAVQMVVRQDALGISIPLVLNLAQAQHILVVPQRGAVAVDAQAVGGHQAETFLAVAQRPAIHRNLGPQGKVVGGGHCGVVEGQAVGGLGLNLTLVVLRPHGHGAILIDLMAIVCIVGGITVTGEVPGHLCLCRCSHHSGGGSLGALLTADSDHGDAVFLTHSQAAEGELTAGHGLRQRNTVCAGAGHFISGRLTALGPHGGQAAVFLIMYQRDGRHCQGQYKFRAEILSCSLLHFVHTGSHGGEQIGAGGHGSKAQNTGIALSGIGRGLEYLALFIQHGNHQRVSAIVTDGHMHGHIQIAAVLHHFGNSGQLHRCPRLAAGGPACGFGNQNAVNPHAAAVIRGGRQQPVGASLQMISQSGLCGGAHLGDALHICNSLAGSVEDRHSRGVAAAGAGYFDHNIGSAGHGKVNGTGLVLGHFHGLDGAIARSALGQLANGGEIAVLRQSALRDLFLVSRCSQRRCSKAVLADGGSSLLHHGDAVNPHAAAVIRGGRQQPVGASLQMISQSGLCGGAHLGDALHICNSLAGSVEDRHSRGVAAAGAGYFDHNIGSAGHGKVNGTGLVLGHFHGLDGAIARSALGQLANGGEITILCQSAFRDLFLVSRCGQCRCIEEILATGGSLLLSSLGHFHLVQVVGTIRYTQIVSACSLHSQFGNVQLVLHSRIDGLAQNVAFCIKNGELTAIATGDPPQLDRGCAGGGKTNGREQSLGHIRFGLEIDTLATCVTICKGLAVGINSGICGKHQGKITLSTHSQRLAFGLGAGSDHFHISAGIQGVNLFFRRLSQDLPPAGGQQTQHHDKRQRHRQQFFHCLPHSFITSC